jgi:hypothetical protein
MNYNVKKSCSRILGRGIPTSLACVKVADRDKHTSLLHQRTIATSKSCIVQAGGGGVNQKKQGKWMKLASSDKHTCLLQHRFDGKI